MSDRSRDESAVIANVCFILFAALAAIAALWVLIA